jgi:hypothetical protein
MVIVVGICIKDSEESTVVIILKEVWREIGGNIVIVKKTKR